MKENKKSYDLDFKIRAVVLSFENESVSKVAEKFNITSRSIFHWRKIYVIHGVENFSSLGKIRLSPEEKKIYDLEMKIKKLNLKFEIIKEARDYNRKGQLFTFNFIARNEQKYSSYLMCKVLGVNLGTYNKWKNDFVSEKQKWRMMVKEEIKTIFSSSKQRYGCRRIAAELKKLGYNLSDSTVLRYMRELDLYVSVKKNSQSMRTNHSS